MQALRLLQQQDTFQRIEFEHTVEAIRAKVRSSTFNLGMGWWPTVKGACRVGCMCGCFQSIALYCPPSSSCCQHLLRRACFALPCTASPSYPHLSYFVCPALPALRAAPTLPSTLTHPSQVLWLQPFACPRNCPHLPINDSRPSAPPSCPSRQVPRPFLPAAPAFPSASTHPPLLAAPHVESHTLPSQLSPPPHG